MASSRQQADRALVLQRQNVSRETIERLDRFVALLLTWQSRTNLIAPSTVDEIWSRHVEDGLILAGLAPEPARWADLGSGGGFPGIVLGIAGANRPGAFLDLVESNNKKAAFLRAALRECAVAGEVHAMRIEAAGAVLGSCEAVSARALAPLGELFALVAGKLRPGVKCYFFKGRNHEEEIAEASAQWRFSMVKHRCGAEAGSVILEISDLARRVP